MSDEGTVGISNSPEAIDKDNTKAATGSAPSLAKWRTKLVPYFVGVTTVALLMIGVCLWMIYDVVTHPPDYTRNTLDVMVLATLYNVGLGMIIGLASIAFGVAMCWVGIEAPFSLHAKSGAESLPLAVGVQSIGPGLVLLIGGMLICYSSLHLPIEVEPTEGGSYHTKVNGGRPSEADSPQELHKELGGQRTVPLEGFLQEPQPEKNGEHN